jgi:hypothetical protein
LYTIPGKTTIFYRKSTNNGAPRRRIHLPSFGMDAIP